MIFPFYRICRELLPLSGPVAFITLQERFLKHDLSVVKDDFQGLGLRHIALPGKAAHGDRDLALKKALGRDIPGCVVVHDCLGFVDRPRYFMNSMLEALSPKGYLLLFKDNPGKAKPPPPHRLSAEGLWRLLASFRSKVVFTTGRERFTPALFALASPALLQPGLILDVNSSISRAVTSTGAEDPGFPAPWLYKSIPIAIQGQLASYLDMAEDSSNEDVLKHGGVLSKITLLLGRCRKKPRVVLVHPPFTRKPEKPTTSDRVVVHGLGLMISRARQHGYDFSLLDNRLLNDWELYRAQLEQARPDILGIGTGSADWHMAEQCATIARELFPKVKIIAGGPHPSLATHDVAANAHIDHIVIGDGELTFVELIEALSAGASPRRIIHGRKPVLDALPFVDRDVFKGNEHLMPPLWFGASPWVSMISSRGCMFNCSFCAPASKIMFGRKVRRRSPANVIRELEILRDKYDFQHLRFYDDNIIESRSWTREFCRLYRRGGFTATFGIAGRADLICQREDLIALLAETGMLELNIGFESGSQKILDLLNKRTTVAQNIRAAQILKSHGVKVIVSVMFGIPEETHHDIDETIALIDLTQPDWVDPSFLTPYPGTMIHEYCRDRQLDLVRDSRAYDRGYGSSPKIKGSDYAYAIEKLGKRFGPQSNWSGEPA